MTPEVSGAVEEIRHTFAGHPIEVEDESQGGAYVVVRNLDVGERFKPASIWLGFLIPFQYPDADVYPHFTEAGFARVDGAALGAGFSGVTWKEQSVLQVSRRSNRWNPAVDTAAAKLIKVLEWIKLR